MEQLSNIVQQSTHTVSSDGDSGCALDEYTWVPPGLTAQQVAEYMHALPVNCIPYAGGSVGDRWRASQLLRQLPPQDTEVRYCHGLSDEEKRELRLFSAQRRHDALGRATVLPVTMSAKCHQCARAMDAGDLAVYASRAEPGTIWHPACFTCCVCLELLVDLIYFYSKDGQLYCGRHHAETLKPRCSACDEIIFSDECTEAEGHSWHTKHFVCCDCDLPLGGQRYVMTDGRPFCCVCYERLYSAECATCQQSIHVTEGHMVHGSRRWHAVDSCFRCDSCASSLLGCPFVAIPGKDAIYCADCGITYKMANYASYVNKNNDVGANCYPPSSPLMKVREPNGKELCSKSETPDEKQCFEHMWSEESPVKVASKFVSPQNSAVQCKPAAGELQTHTACKDPSTCCDDHRLSAEFQVCSSSGKDPSNDVLASEPSSQNQSFLFPVSPTKISASDPRLVAQTDACGDMSDARMIIGSPRLVASVGDFLDNAEEINSGLEELIVEPLWNRKEPEGLLAEGADMPDNLPQKSRKSKNLNVRFDPSTKDPCSPMVHGVYCDHWRPSSHRSLDDSDIPYMSCGSHCHTAGPDGSASVRIRRRKYGYDSHRRHNDKWPDTSSRKHRASMNQGWWMDGGDDYEHCSTCSSSSSDSDFDYSEAAFHGKTAPLQSQTLPQRRRNIGSAEAMPALTQTGVMRSKKHKKKHCIVS